MAEPQPDWMRALRDARVQENERRQVATESAELARRRVQAGGPQFWAAFLQNVDYLCLKARQEFGDAVRLEWNELSPAPDAAYRLTVLHPRQRRDFRYQLHGEQIRIFDGTRELDPWWLMWTPSGLRALVTGTEHAPEELARLLIEPLIRQALAFQ